MGARRTVVAAGSLTAGVLLADRIRPAFTVALVAGILSVLLLAFSWLAHRSNPSPEPGELYPKLSRASAVFILTGLILMGLCDLSMRLAAMESSPFLDAERRVMEVEGTLVRDPYPTGRALRIELKTYEVNGVSAKWRISARVFGGPRWSRDLMVGDRIRMAGSFRPLVSKDRFDLTMMRRGVVAEGTVSGTDIEKTGRARGLFAVANHVRRRMQQLTAHLSPAKAGLVLGLTIGDDAGLPEELRDDMRTTGLTHLTAVSGANVAIVLGAAILILRGAGASRRTIVVSGLSVVSLFVLVARWEPSVLRAGFMAALGLIAYVVGRRSSPFNAAGVAFIGLVAIDPLILWSIGFQLSFAASLGILILGPSLKDRLERLRRRPPVWAADALSVGLAAQVAVTPLIAFHFGRVSVVSPIANLAAFPLVAPVTVLGMVGGFLGALWLPLGGPFVAASGAFAGALSLIATFFARLPFASIAVPDIELVTLLVLYGAIGALTLWIRGAGKGARRLVVVAALFWILVTVTPASSSPPEGLRVRFFDVGQGEAALVESPGGARVLVDGGPDEDFVASRLARLGVTRLDLVVFSHAHADHIVGLREVLDDFEVRVAVYPGVGQILRGEATAEEVSKVGDGEGFVIGDIDVRFLGPPGDLLALARTQSLEGEGAGLNDASVILRLAWRGSCVLFTGDVEEEGQEALVAKHRQDIQCEIMKAPHHGSPRIVEEFVETADPDFVVVSVGRNDYGHPSRKAMSMFQRAGARTLRTDRLGDIVLVIDENGRIDA